MALIMPMRDCVLIVVDAERLMFDVDSRFVEHCGYDEPLVVALSALTSWIHD